MGILTAIMLFSFLFATVPVHAAGGASGEYLGNEVVAGGNWSTKFGTDGYLLPYKAYDGTGGIAGERLGEFYTVSKVPSYVTAVSVSDPSSVNPNQDSSGSANYPVLVKEDQTLDTDVNTNSQVINYDGSMTYTLSLSEETLVGILFTDNSDRGAKKVEVFDTAAPEESLAAAEAKSYSMTTEILVFRLNGDVTIRCSFSVVAPVGLLFGMEGEVTPPVEEVDPSSAEAVGFDGETKGAWYNTYGAEGWMNLRGVDTENENAAIWKGRLPQNMQFSGLKLSDVNPKYEENEEVETLPYIPEEGKRVLPQVLHYDNTVSFTLSFPKEDTAKHKVAIYFADNSEDQNNRGSKTVTMKNSAGEMLAAQTVTNEQLKAGTYAVFTITGTVNVTVDGGGNPVMFVGMYFGDAVGEAVKGNASVAFIEKIDTMSGNWMDEGIGSAGYWIPQLAGWSASQALQSYPNFGAYYKVPAGGSILNSGISTINPTYMRPVDEDSEEKPIRLQLPGTEDKALPQVISYDKNMAFTITLPADKEYAVYFYYATHVLDTADRNSRTVKAYNGITGAELAIGTLILSNQDIHDGVYVKFVMSGSVSFEFSNPNGADPMMPCGIFLDEIVLSAEAFETQESYEVNQEISVDLSGCYLYNGAEDVTITASKGTVEGKTWKYTPAAAGTETVEFTVKAGMLESRFTVTLNVTDASVPPVGDSCSCGASAMTGGSLWLGMAAAVIAIVCAASARKKARK